VPGGGGTSQTKPICQSATLRPSWRVSAIGEDQTHIARERLDVRLRVVEEHDDRLLLGRLVDQRLDLADADLEEGWV